MIQWKRRITLAIITVLLLCVTVTVSGCGKGKQTTEPAKEVQQESNISQNEDRKEGVTEQETQISEEFSILQRAAQEFVRQPVKLLSTDEVYQLITNNNISHQLISTREREHYDLGHIKGAIHIHRNEFGYDSALDKLEKDKQIVLYCYTANGASYVAAMLNLMGYDAYGMAMGMTEWTENREVAATEHVPQATISYPISTVSNELGNRRQLPELNTGYTTVEDIVKATGQAYFASGRNRWVSSDHLWNNIQDGPSFSPYVVIDIRDSHLYDKGHIPTSINIPYEQTMDLTVLERLPLNKRLIIVSEDGQAATQVAALYNFLGYDSATLLYGMMTWTEDPEIIGRPLWEGFRNYSYSS